MSRPYRNSGWWNVIDFSSERLIVNSDVEHQTCKGRLISYLPEQESDRRWVCAFCSMVRHVLWVRPPSARSVARSLHCDRFFVSLCFRLLRRIEGEGGKGRISHQETRSIAGNLYNFRSHWSQLFLLYFMRQNVPRSCHRCR